MRWYRAVAAFFFPAFGFFWVFHWLWVWGRVMAEPLPMRVTALEGGVNAAMFAAVFFLMGGLHAVGYLIERIRQLEKELAELRQRNQGAALPHYLRAEPTGIRRGEGL
jgi:hypothetical protein